METNFIKLHNDGKQKDYSCEVSSDLFFGTAYGESEEEAITLYKHLVQEQIEKLQGLDYTKILYVDWSGKPLPNQTVLTS